MPVRKSPSARQRDVVEARPAQHADGREPRHERLPRVRHAEDGAVSGVVAHEGVVALGIGERAADDVDVRVDEPGQERRVAEVDHAGARRDGHTGLRAHRGDAVTSDHDRSVAQDGAAVAVDEPSRLEDDRRLGLQRRGEESQDRGEQGGTRRGET
jgi:hypothetical protein